MVTHLFDPGSEGPPFKAVIRLVGRRSDVVGRPRPSDAFTHEETIERVVPGSGPISITSTVNGVANGRWNVTGTVLKRVAGDASGAARLPSMRDRPETLERASWVWRRWSVHPVPSEPVASRWALTAPLSRIPAVQPGTWPVLGAVGAVVALAVQVAILNARAVPAGTPLLISIAALIAGMLGAKVWYAVLHPGPLKQALLGGWSVDGFLVVAPVVATTLLLLTGQPVGEAMDAVAPGMFLAVAIGRIGCLFTGCCAGPLTDGRFAVWSSDRRVGGRRVPAQLLESAAGFGIAAVSALAIVFSVRPFPGSIFLGAIIVYVVARQLLLRVRDERREFSWRRTSKPAR